MVVGPLSGAFLTAPGLLLAVYCAVEGCTAPVLQGPVSGEGSCLPLNITCPTASYRKHCPVLCWPHSWRQIISDTIHAQHLDFLQQERRVVFPFAKGRWISGITAAANDRRLWKDEAARQLFLRKVRLPTDRPPVRHFSFLGSIRLQPKPFLAFHA
jgi:hypothetical protein